jgi:putative FmdB family regulatory protein
MPLYYFECKDCKAPDKRILEPEQVRATKCRKCGGKVRRLPKPPTSVMKNRIDNGLMPKTLENFDDAQQLTYERSHLDLSRPDWQKNEP